MWNDHRVRFLVIGATNTVWGIASFPIFYLIANFWGIHYQVVLIFTYFVNTTVSFATQKIIVFKSKGNLYFEYLKFLGFQGLVLIVNLVLLPVAMEKWNLGPVLPQIGFSILVALISFFVHKFITFNQPSQ